MRNKSWDIILLILRIWLGYQMMRNGKYIFIMPFSGEYRKFFEDWFGNTLHFPFPLVMAYLAKGAEFFGGLFVFLGVFSRAGAFLIAFTMGVATLVANIGKHWDVDGTITVSFCLLAIIFIYWGPGKYAIGSLLKKAR